MPKKRKPGRPRADRNGLREAILGLLAIRPMSGYDVSLAYRRALQQIWYAPLGQIYPTLRRMRADGLLSVSIEVQHDKPNRKVYDLTEKGKRLLVEWLLRPSALPNMHHEFIHKLFLLNHVEPQRQLELVRSYVERSKAWLGELTAIERRLKGAVDGPNGKTAWYQLMSLRHLIRLVRTEARSAKITLDELTVYIARSKANKKRRNWKRPFARGDANEPPISPTNGQSLLGLS